TRSAWSFAESERLQFTHVTYVTMQQCNQLNRAPALPAAGACAHAKAAKSETSFRAPPGCPPQCARCVRAQSVARSLIQDRCPSFWWCKTVRKSGLAVLPEFLHPYRQRSPIPRPNLHPFAPSAFRHASSPESHFSPNLPEPAESELRQTGSMA